jgi:hypothetical protein
VKTLLRACAALAAALIAAAALTACGGGPPGWCPALHTAEHSPLTQAHRTAILTQAATRWHEPQLATFAHAAGQMASWQARENGPISDSSVHAVTEAANWAKQAATITRPLDATCGFTH